MIELLLKGQGLLIALLSLVMGAGAVLFRARVLELVADRAPQASVAALDQRVGGVEGRLHSIETAIRHLPTSEQMHNLNVSLTELRGEMRSLTVKVTGVETLINAQGRKRTPPTGGLMSSYTALIAEDRRLSILLLLDAAPAGTANEALLQSALLDFGHQPSADQVRADLAWLGEQGLATTRDMHGLLVATVTVRGGDVAAGRAVVPGVKRPRRGA